MQTYSLDSRLRIAQARAEAGARQVQVARFCVSVAFVGKLLLRQRQTGQAARHRLG
jgi:transposase